MPRPRKCRRVCSMPHCTHFDPSPRRCGEDVVMSVDEYETIRLIDFEGLTQEQCAEQMCVARTTAQAMYSAARKKLAECIVQGRRMKIAGGDIHVCEQKGEACGGCCKLRGGFSGNATAPQSVPLDLYPNMMPQAEQIIAGNASKK